MNKKTSNILIGTVMAIILVLESGPVMWVAASDGLEEISSDGMTSGSVEELVVAYDEAGDEIPLEEVEADYDGFVFKLKDDATRT